MKSIAVREGVITSQIQVFFRLDYYDCAAMKGSVRFHAILCGLASERRRSTAAEVPSLNSEDLGAQ